MYSLLILDCNSCAEVGAPLDDGAAGEDGEVDDSFGNIELVSDVKDETTPLVREADDW